MKKTHLIPLFILSICFLSCIQKTKQHNEKQEVIASQKQGWSVLNRERYSIEFPNSWQMDKSNQQGVEFILISPKPDSADKFTENINLTKEKLPLKKIGLQEYTDEALKTLIANFKQIHLIKNEEIINNDISFQQILYTAKVQKFDLIFEQHLFIKNGYAYILTLSGEEKEFDNYREIGEKIMNSFATKN